MKTCILTLAAIAAVTGSALADSGDLRLVIRSNPHGQPTYVYVREPQPDTTVAIYRHGRGLSRHETADSRESRPVRFEERKNAQGQSFYVYSRAR